MSLEEKFERIGRGGGILKQAYPCAMSATIQDLWNDFIEPRLPRVETVIAWHRILMDYITRPGAVFAIRIFNEDNENLIRRGFYTQTNDNYSFFYTDNSFAYFIARIVLDGDCIPSPEEFFNFCHNRRIPYKLVIRGNKENEERYANAFPRSTRDPKITKYHKLAHLYSVGERFNWNEKQELNIAEVADTLFPRGVHGDWRLTGDVPNCYYVRDWTIADDDMDETKRLLIAHFLRFVHPMNYFLAPKQKTNGRIYHRYSFAEGYVRYDIGEYEPLLKFVKKKFHERYTIDGHDYYQEFLNQILPFNDETLQTATLRINATYSSDPLNVAGGEPAVNRPRNANRPAANRQVNAQRGEGPAIELVPNDPARFKAALLRVRSARRTWVFANGVERPETWNASNMNEQSNVMGNIRSTSIFKKWRENGLVRVRIVVEE